MLFVKTKGIMQKFLLPVYLPQGCVALPQPQATGRVKPLLKPNSLVPLGPQGKYGMRNKQTLTFFPQWFLSPHYHAGFKGPESSPIRGLLYPCPWPSTPFQLSPMPSVPAAAML